MHKYHLGGHTVLGEMTQTVQIQQIAIGRSGIARQLCIDATLLKCLCQSRTIKGCAFLHSVQDRPGFNMDLIFDIGPLTKADYKIVVLPRDFFDQKPGIRDFVIGQNQCIEAIDAF